MTSRSQPCPNCDASLDEFPQPDVEIGFEPDVPGDLGVCPVCGGIVVFAELEDGRVRAPTDDERAEWRSLPGWRAAAKRSAEIRAVRRSDVR